MPVVEGYGALREIGRGGFSQVYEALQFEFERWVALKVLNETLDGDDEAAEFMRECRLMGVLSRHPNIVTVLDSAFAEAGLPCIVMELYPNGSYLDVLQASGPLGLEEILSVAVSVSGALATAHRQGVIHGDVKPQNIFRSEFGAALGDFGIASLINHGYGPAKTRLSLYYAAPEVIERGAAALSPFSDQYSLAATVYTLATGERPFRSSESDSTRELLLEALTSPVPRLGDGFPPELADALQKAMDREPALRHRDMRAFAESMGEIETGLGYRPTEFRILRDSGRYTAQVPGQSSSSREIPAPGQSSSSREISQPGGAAPADRSSSGPVAPTPRSRTASRELPGGHGDTTVVRPTPTVAAPPPETPLAAPVGKRRKIALIAASALLVALIAAAVLLMSRDSRPGETVSATQSGDTPASADTAPADAAAAAEAAVTRAEEALEAAVDAEGVDPERIAELERELQELRAVAEARAADGVSQDAAPAVAPEPETATPLVPAPSNLTLTPLVGGLGVTWDAPEGTAWDILQYRVEWGLPNQSDDPAAVEADGRYEVVRPSDLMAEIDGLDSGTQYVVRVAARVAEGLGEWALASAPTIGVPAQPTVTGAVVGHQAITVRWRMPDDTGVTGYRVEWESDGAAGGSADVPPAPGDGGLSYEIGGLTNGVEYRIRVQAVGDAGTSVPAFSTATPMNLLPVRVAYTSDRDGLANVHAVTPDGVSAEPLLLDAASEAVSRSWSPDRAWLLTDHRIGGSDWEVVAVNSQTGETRQLTCNSLIDDWGAAWSPDGTRIAFVREVGGNHDIYTLDLATGTETQITATREDDGSPSWSPDGSRIAFSRGPRVDRQIWVVDVATGSASRLTSGGRHLNAPSWSPDGSRIAFASGYGTDRDIVTMRPDGTDRLAITSGGHHDDTPSWSPDGSRIVFARGLGPERDIYVADVGTQQLSLLVATGGDDHSPVWSPDSENAVAVDPRSCA